LHIDDDLQPLLNWRFAFVLPSWRPSPEVKNPASFAVLIVVQQKRAAV